jgi:hypothetical protein
MPPSLRAVALASCLACIPGLATAETLPGVRGPLLPMDAGTPRGGFARALLPVVSDPSVPSRPDLQRLAQAAPGDPPGDSPAAEAPADGPARTRTAECADRYGLPRGPIHDCTDAIVVTAVAVTAVAGFVAWWHRGLDTQFDLAHEGWFGPDTYSGGVDKLGHMYSLYVGTRLMSSAFQWAGASEREARNRASALGLGIGLGIEVLDGLARGGKYGFSWQDLVMDVAGVSLAWIAETEPAFDRWFAFRWMRDSGGDPNRRYDHHQYYAVLRPSGWSALGAANPLRYVELLAGYGAIGFRGESSLDSSDQRQRTVYVGVGLNLTELLDRTVWTTGLGGGYTQWFATQLLRYVQIPGTAATTSAKTWSP